MKFILGKKLEMSQVFDDEGNVTPVTLVQAGPVVVTQIKTKEKDGYDALQIGFGKKSKSKMKKPQQGHLGKTQNSKLKTQNSGIRWMREMKMDSDTAMKEGDDVTVSVFQEGEKVEVSGVSKGKGFQGVVKRHGFHGGPRTHGQKHSEREPGSIGGSSGRAGGKVAKGMRMGGRMGSDRVTLKNVRVVKIDIKQNILALKGALPGAFGSLVEIKGKEQKKK
ncbi:MAG: 50S ribosomal protein L3 [bacterium]|nr:50S ribosomal protein L3 [bacterium]